MCSFSTPQLVLYLNDTCSNYSVRLIFVSKSLLATVEPGSVCPKEMKFWKVRVVIFLTGILYGSHVAQLGILCYLVLLIWHDNDMFLFQMGCQPIILRGFAYYMNGTRILSFLKLPFWI